MSDIERLRMVSSVARTRSICETARVHGVAQSTVTRSVAAAEALVGFPLFRRGAQGSRLAPGAQPAITLIDRIISDFDALRALSGERPGCLRFGHRADLEIPPRLDNALGWWNRENTLRAEPVELEDPLAELRAGRVEFAVLLRTGGMLPDLETHYVRMMRTSRVELLHRPQLLPGMDEFLRLI